MAAPSNASASSSGETWFVATENNGTFELSLGDLTEAIETGKVPFSALVWRAGMRSWLSLNEVPLLQLLIARLDLSRVSAAQSSPSAAAVTAPMADQVAELVPPRLPQPLEFDDDDLTVVASGHNALLEIDDDDLTVVTKFHDEFSPEGNVEHSPLPPLAAAAQPSDMRPLLVRRIIAVESAKGPPVANTIATEEPVTAPLAAQPIANEESATAPLAAQIAESESSLDAAAHKKPSLSDRAPPKPQSVPAIPVAAPVPAVPASHVAAPERDRPSASSLLALAGRAESPKASGSVRAPTFSPPRQSAPPLRSAKGPWSNTPPNPAIPKPLVPVAEPVAISAVPVAEPVAISAVPVAEPATAVAMPVAEPATAVAMPVAEPATTVPMPVAEPATSVAGPIAVTSATAPVMRSRPPLPVRAARPPAEAERRSVPSIQSAPPIITNPAAVVMQAPVVVPAVAHAPPPALTAPALIAPPQLPAPQPAEAFIQDERSGYGPSLAPSVSSITSALRPSRRPLYVAAASVLAVAALALIFVGSKPTRPSRSVAATNTQLDPTRKSPEPPSVSQRAEPAPAAQPPSARLDAERAQAAALPSADSPSITPPPKSASAELAAPRAASKLSSTRSDSMQAQAPAPKRQPTTKLAENEPPPAKRVRSDTETPPAKASKKPDNAASVAAWDQGTVEHRAWMSPGF